MTSDVPLEQLIHHQSAEVLIMVAGDPRLTEDLALALLKRRDLPRQTLEQLNKNGAVIKHRKVSLAIVMHPRTPRHVAIPMIRHLYAFELMQIALLPSVGADVKRAAEDTLIAKLETISAGERYGLAKQGSGRIAAALLLDKEERIMQAALSNSRMTEPLVVNILRSADVTEQLVAAVCHNEKWSRRNEIKMALLASEYTPFAKVLQFTADLPVRVLKEVLHTSRLRDNVKKYLHSVIDERAGNGPQVIGDTE
jgi:hypothetical protein